VAGQLPTGRPKVDVSIVLELELKIDGTLARGKNHTLPLEKVEFEERPYIYNNRRLTRFQSLRILSRTHLLLLVRNQRHRKPYLGLW